MNKYYLNHIDELEAEAIFILREVASKFDNPVLLFSGGKDSIVLTRLAKKAFYPAQIPFKLLHVDTGHNFPEILESNTLEETVEILYALIKNKLTITNE